MAWSITIGTVKGTVIRLHITFLLFLLWPDLDSRAELVLAKPLI
jgi:hypothetical protein